MFSCLCSSVFRTLPVQDAVGGRVFVQPLSADHGRGCHFQIRRCLLLLSCFCLLRQPPLSAWMSVNTGAAGNFGIVFPSLFLCWHSKSRSGCLDISEQSAYLRICSRGGDMINSCEGRTVCTAASDWYLLFYIGDFFLPLKVARLHIFDTWQQQSLDAFCIH